MILAFDSFGIQGSIFHYSLIIACVGSTLLLLIYFGRKGRLDMDEEAKIQMMQNFNSIQEDFDDKE